MKRNSCGFTLIEIAVAVAILGLALTTLIGLQTRMLSTYYNEKNRTKAAFYAQYIMTILEVQADAPEPGSKDGDLEDLLDEIGFFDTDELHKDMKDDIEGWGYSRNVTSIDLPIIEDALRRVDLTVSWGEGEDQSFGLLYFVSNIAGTQGLGTQGTPSGTPSPYSNIRN